MNALGDFVEMAKRLVAVEVKVEHLSEKVEVINNTIEAHSMRTEKSLQDMGSKIDHQNEMLNRIKIWLEAAPKLIKIVIGIFLTATLFSSSGWKVMVDMIISLIK
jgi:hypothetical protein